ncbi:MAG TPA: glutamate:protein symporter, partial [Lysinibacillus sp.]|nr:glutamate:protein symporter [Lysinibacillus sp.]
MHLIVRSEQALYSDFSKKTKVFSSDFVGFYKYLLLLGKPQKNNMRRYEGLKKKFKISLASQILIGLIL